MAGGHSGMVGGPQGWREDTQFSACWFVFACDSRHPGLPGERNGDAFKKHHSVIPLNPE